MRCAEGENIFAHKRKNLFALRALCYTRASDSHRSTLRVTCRLRQYPSASANEKEQAKKPALFRSRCTEGENIFAHKRENLFALRALCDTEAVKLPPEHAASNLPLAAVSLRLRQNGKSTLAVLFLVAVCGG